MDMPIQEQSPFSPRWYSHKLNGPGLRYEIGISLATGWIIWVNGPYPAGEYNDLQITRLGLLDALDHDEYFLADGGYHDSGGRAITPSGYWTFVDRQQATARARHETCNSRFKDWGILTQTFHHSIDLHGSVFHAIANITQASLQFENPLFQIDYHEEDI